VTPPLSGAAPKAAAPPDTAAPAAVPSPVGAAPSMAPAPARGRVLSLERRRGDEAGAEMERGGEMARAATPSRVLTSPAAAADGFASGDDRTVATAPTLEVLLGELAHELRNPMVTIKTFAQHLDSVLDDPEVRARFAALTGEAITRMDTLTAQADAGNCDLVAKGRIGGRFQLRPRLASLALRRAGQRRGSDPRAVVVVARGALDGARCR
jgi:signal transduction histidine kinase